MIRWQARDRYVSIGVLCLSLLLTEACSSNPPVKPQTSPRPGTLQGDLYTTAAIHNRGVASPVGRLTSLRKDNSLCAIRFTSFDLGQEAKEARSSDTAEVPSAEYDWYFLPNALQGFAKGPVRSGHALLSDKENVGIGRFSFERGSRTVRCGSMELGWGYPTWLSLIVVTNEGLRWNGIEIAPTAWKEVSQVDIADPTLRWYRHDDAIANHFNVGRPIEIPVTELPGGK